MSGKNTKKIKQPLVFREIIFGFFKKGRENSFFRRNFEIKKNYLLILHRVFSSQTFQDFKSWKV